MTLVVILISCLLFAGCNSQIVDVDTTDIVDTTVKKDKILYFDSISMELPDIVFTGTVVKIPIIMVHQSQRSLDCILSYNYDVSTKSHKSNKRIYLEDSIMACTLYLNVNENVGSSYVFDIELSEYGTDLRATYRKRLFVTSPLIEIENNCSFVRRGEKLSLLFNTLDDNVEVAVDKGAIIGDSQFVFQTDVNTPLAGEIEFSILRNNVDIGKVVNRYHILDDINLKQGEKWSFFKRYTNSSDLGRKTSLEFLNVELSSFEIINSNANFRLSTSSNWYDFYEISEQNTKIYDSGAVKKEYELIVPISGSSVFDYFDEMDVVSRLLVLHLKSIGGYGTLDLQAYGLFDNPPFIMTTNYYENELYTYCTINEAISPGVGALLFRGEYSSSHNSSTSEYYHLLTSNGIEITHNIDYANKELAKINKSLEDFK